MTEAMREIANRLGLPTDDAQLLRLTNNAVFAFPTAGLVIRITRSHLLHERVHKVARLAAWFAEVDAPTIRLVSGIEQPLYVGDLLATVWRYVPPAASAPSVADLGRSLREFHALGAAPFPLPPWDPAGDARRRLADAEALQEADREFLLDWCDRVAVRVTDLTAHSEPRLVHADAHVGNLLREPDGRVVLCDFDATCIGPWQVDLAAVAVGEIRFNRAGTYQDLAAAYGYDVRTDPSWSILREARELKMVAAAVPLLASTPGVAEEFAIRLGSIMRGDDQASWTPFADLPGGRP